MNTDEAIGVSRCRSCNLPEGKLSVVLNDRGICNYCEHLERHRKRVLNVAGREQILTKKLQQVRGKYEYEAVVGLSGGKDSTYVLYQAVKKYNLKVAAVTLDNGFLTDYARQSVKNTVEALGVDHYFYKPDWEAYRKFYKATVRKLGNPCTACALGGYFLAIKACCENRIPLFIHGRSPFQMYRNYRKNSRDLFLTLMRLNLTGNSWLSDVGGCLSLLKSVPVRSIPGLVRQARGGGSRGRSVHRYVYGRVNEYAKQAISRIADNAEEAREITGEFFVDSGRLTTEFAPEFLAYFLFEEYNEEKIKKFLEDNLNWRRSADDSLMGHSDCALHDAAAYMYKKVYDMDMLESDVAVMVRFGALSRERAEELVKHNQPTADSTEKSLDLVCSLCEIDREDLEKILAALKEAGADRFGVLV